MFHRRASVVCSGPGPAADGTGLLLVGMRTLNESGSLGNWERPQIELFCICHLINMVLDADEEFICMDVHFAVGETSIICAHLSHPL